MDGNRVFSSLFQQKNYFEIIDLFGILLVGLVSSCFIANIKQFFCFMRKKVLIMQRMQMLVNYADPHHRIPSNALFDRFKHQGNLAKLYFVA